MDALNPHGARKALIMAGKCLPFILCFIILVAYAETLFACLLSHYLMYGGVVIPNTPLSFIVGLVFECDYLVVGLACLVSLAIEACKWNFIADFYMLFHLLEKSYFDFELSIESIYIIVIANILVSGYIVFKGIKTFTKTKQL